MIMGGYDNYNIKCVITLITNNNYQNVLCAYCLIQYQHYFLIRYFTVMYLLSIDWWSTKAARSNVVTRNYMQTNMPGKYV